MSHIEIQTTQNIHLEYEIASIGERFIAALLDGLILLLWLTIWSLIISRFHIGSIWILVIVAGPVLFYFLLCELLLNGQSPGKRIMSVRVVKIDGTAPSFGDYFLRWIFRLVDNFIAIAIVCMAVTAKCQRLGDLAAKTCVVRTKNKALPAKAPEMRADYCVTYETATLLGDSDAALIARIISNPAILRNSAGMKKLADKVKTVTQTSSDASDHVYLHKILEDYYYLSGKL